LSIAVCNSPSLRNYLIANLKEESKSIAIVEIDKQVTDVLDLVSKTVPGANSTGIFVVGIEKLMPSDRNEHKVIKALNATRELWRSHFSCPVVFWVPEYASALLSIHARDLWSWLSHKFEFMSEQATASAGMLDKYAGDIISAGRLDADQKRFRIAELEQRIEDAGEPPKPELVQHILIWFNELAYIYKAIGDLDKSQQNILKSLEIAERLGLQTTVADAYGNLGLIYETRGDLDKAEKMYLKSLEIDKKLGRLEGMSTAYGNLGLIYIDKGELDKAEELHLKALEIDEKIGHLEGMANQYGNLGLIYQTKGDLDKAKDMHNKSLEIEKKLGRLEGMASEYGNLGLIYRTKGDLDKAEDMHNKSLEINKKLGRLEGMAKDYGNLGVIYKTKGDLAKAEEMHLKALEIDKKIGRLEGQAIRYGNLGSVYEQRGDIRKAREYWEKALGLFKKIGMPHMVERVEGLIEGIGKGKK